MSLLPHQPGKDRGNREESFRLEGRLLQLKLENLLSDSLPYAEREVSEFCSRQSSTKLNARGSPIDLTDLQIQTFTARGPSHIANGLPNQDSLSVRRTKEVIALALSDGVSSSPNSERASQFLAETTARLCCEIFTSTKIDLRDDTQLTKFCAELHSRLYVEMLRFCSEQTEMVPFRGARSFCDATIELAVITPITSIVLSLGDGLYQLGKNISPIEVLTGRTFKTRHSGSNVPPLLAHLFEGHLSAPYDLVLGLKEEVEELFEEAKAFKVVARFPSEQITLSGFGLYTDGVPEKAGSSGEVFPLHQLFRFEGLSSDSLSDRALLWDLDIDLRKLSNLVITLNTTFGVLYRENPSYDLVVKDFKPIQEQFLLQESETFADLLQDLSRIENAILSESFARIAPKQLCSYRNRFTLDDDSKQVLRALEHPGTTLEKRIAALFLLHEELGETFSEIGLTRPTNGHRVRDDMSGIWIAPENRSPVFPSSDK